MDEIDDTRATASGAEAGSGSGSGAGAGASAADVAAYAAAVRAELADLSADEVAELLEDLEDHLREVAAEDTGDLRERLGTPAAYAAELRASAGLPERGPAPGPSAAPPRRHLADLVAELERRLRTQWLGREVLDFLPLLRPAWWIVRAWLAVFLLQLLTTGDGSGQLMVIPRPGDSALLGMLLLVLAIAASIWLTRRPPLRGRRGRLFAGFQAVLGVMAVVVLLHGMSENPSYAVTATGYPGPIGLNDSGAPITNLYVYDQDGKLLDGVYVYDQDGNPVDSVPEAHGDQVIQNYVDADGSFVLNRYPQVVGRVVYGSNGAQHLLRLTPPPVLLPSGVRPIPNGDGSFLPQSPTTPSGPAGPTTAAASPGGPSASPASPATPATPTTPGTPRSSASGSSTSASPAATTPSGGKS